MKTNRLTETDLKRIIGKVLSEEQLPENYMFFSNLRQIKRQCEMLLEMDESMVDSIIQNGHDWKTSLKLKKQVLNYVQEVRRRLRLSLRFIPQLTLMVMLYRFVKVRCQVLTEKNIVQVLIVNY